MNSGVSCQMILSPIVIQVSVTVLMALICGASFKRAVSKLKAGKAGGSAEITSDCIVHADGD